MFTITNVKRLARNFIQNDVNAIQPLTPLSDTVLIVAFLNTCFRVRLRYDVGMYCVRWGVELYSLTHLFSRCSHHSEQYNVFTRNLFISLAAMFLACLLYAHAYVPHSSEKNRENIHPQLVKSLTVCNSPALCYAAFVAR